MIFSSDFFSHVQDPHILLYFLANFMLCSLHCFLALTCMRAVWAIFPFPYPSPGGTIMSKIFQGRFQKSNLGGKKIGIFGENDPALHVTAL